MATSLNYSSVDRHLSPGPHDKHVTGTNLGNRNFNVPTIAPHSGSSRAERL